jgi:hypothetical protein
MPILGIIASSKFGDAGDFESIATTTVGSGGSSTITFSSIPSTYKHLQIRCLAKTDRADTDDVILMQFNSDTAANYSWHYIRGNGTVASSSGVANASNISINYGTTGDSGATNIFAGSVIDILDYENTNKYKTVRTLNGLDLNGSGYIYLASGNWRSTSAISSIVLNRQYGTNFKQYSQFALYGIRSA